MISVCVATYNGERYIEAQLKSILSQLSSQDEVIVSDDGSTDNTIAIIEALDDPRIKIYRNESKAGVNGNFENALTHASGDIIYLADQDDVWVEGKVEATLNALEDCDCVIHDAFVTDGDLNILHDSFYRLRQSGPGFLKNLYKNTYLGCCMAFKRSLLDAILPIPKRNAYYHDNWIGSIADCKYKLKFIGFKGIYFRRHESNTSCTAKSSKYNSIQMLYHRIVQLYDVIQRLIKTA